AISSNSSDGGINEVMNSDGSNGRIKEFNNVTLPSGTEFKVLGSLKVKLVPVNTSSTIIAFGYNANAFLC
ncbi:hypothetical protein ACT453_57120, partial [Bacillus sp. D-CC]